MWELGQGLNVRDGAEFMAGVGEGLVTPVVAVYRLTQRETWEAAGRGLTILLDDPSESAMYLRQQIIDPVINAMSHPVSTIQALNQDPRAFGRVLGGTAAALATISATTWTGRTLSRAFPGPRVSPYRFDPTLGAGEGTTDMFGNIRVSSHGSMLDRMRAIYHEQVHSFFTPRGIRQTTRARVSQWMYNNSHLFRYIEEASAESIAQLRTGGSLRTGLLFPIAEGYVNPVRLAAEGVLFCGGTGVVGNEVAKALR